MSIKGKFLDRPIAFHRSFVDLTGSVNAALILSQACYWALRCEGGRFYKSMDEWKEETGLSRSEQESARANLRRFPFWREEYRRIEHRLYFTVDVDGVAEAVERALTPAETADGNGETIQFPMSKTDIPECRKPTFGNGGNGHSGMPETVIRYKEQRLPEITSERGGGRNSDRPTRSLSNGNGLGLELSDGNGSGGLRKGNKLPAEIAPLFGFAKKYAWETWVKRFGSEPNWMAKDYAQLVALLRRHRKMTREEFAARWGRYIHDNEPFIERQGHSLAYFCSHFDAYIERPSIDLPYATPYPERWGEG